MSKRKRIILSILAGILVFSVAAVLIYEFFMSRRGSRIALPELPGLASSPKEYDPDTLAPGIMKAIEQHLLTSVSVRGRQVDGLLASAYETSLLRGEEGTKTALISAGDQIRYGRALVRMNERTAFFKWLDVFDSAFRSESDDFHASVLKPGTAGSDTTGTAEAAKENSGTDGSAGEAADIPPDTEETGVEPGRDEQPAETDIYVPADPHWSVTLSYTRVLLEGYRRFGGRDLEKRITAESDALLPVFLSKKTDSELLAGPRMLLAVDAWDRPIPGSTPEPGKDAPIERSVGTYLADIDLWALSALARFDPRWAPIAGAWQETVENAALESAMPLYASAVRSEDASYITVTGGGLLSSVREQLAIAVSLAEVGSVNRDFVSFVRSSVRDAKRLPLGWNPVSGSASGSSALPADYAEALILGRISGDALLVETAREVLMQFYAGSQTSDIFGGWFRAGQTAYTYRLVAEDNTAVLGAFR